MGSGTVAQSQARSARMRPIWILAALLLAAATESVAQSATVAPVSGRADQVDPPATLVLAGREVIEFRATVFGYSPADRVAGAGERAREAYGRNPGLALTVVVTSEGARVLADGRTLFTVVPGDVDALVGETPEARAEKAVKQMEKVLENLRERGDPRALGVGLGQALAATLAWLLLLRALMWLDRWAGRRFARVVDGQAHHFRLFGVDTVDPGFLRGFARRLVRMVAWVTAALLSYLWLDLVLLLIPHTRPWGEGLHGLLINVISTIGGGVLDSLPGLAFVAVIVVLARFVSGAGRAFFARVRDQGRSIGWLDRDTANPTAAIFSLVVWLFALAMAYPYLPGSDSEAFKGLSVLVGLMVSIGASGTVGQATSGLMLMYTRAFRVGEFVRIQDVEGTVKEIGLFATRIRTGMGEEVMLPNSVVLGNSSRNYSRAVPGAGFVLDTVVTIGYDTPWRQVVAMLTEAASRVDAIADKPAPRVMQTALSDFYVEYRLIAYAKAQAPLPRAEALDQIHANIQDVFNEHGVQIMSPHYLGDPAAAKVVAKADWYAAPATPPPASL